MELNTKPTPKHVRMQEDKKRFIEVLQRTNGNMGRACKMAGFGRSTVYRWKDEDESFAEAITFVHLDLADNVQEELYLVALSDKYTMQKVKAIEYYLDRAITNTTESKDIECKLG